MDIPVHADVLGTDGPVGKSTYVVVDLVSEKVAHVVVQMDRHSDEYLVPVALIDDADRSVIKWDRHPACLCSRTGGDGYSLHEFGQGGCRGAALHRSQEISVGMTTIGQSHYECNRRVR